MEIEAIQLLRGSQDRNAEIRYHMAKYVLRKVKNVGKPYAGKPHVRFDEEGLVLPVLYSTELFASALAPFRGCLLRVKRGCLIADR
ncbi:hypothetical protein IDH44_10455 [Paenibacillus sp. IB182496]|uniref:Uncharacterized protein n=1 Tax=Paenibacillus sabuli TaxID=2772509 RepID=A0A927GS31_9BACL|nr:hypothetical protein [Paenibacillus sabuli]